MSRRLVLSLAPLAVASVCALAWWLAGPDLELRVAVSLPETSVDEQLRFTALE